MPAQLGTIEPLGDQPVGRGDWLLNIEPGHPLYQPESPAYKGWLWSQMQEPSPALAALYQAQNGAWVGANVRVAGNNAGAVVAALHYVLERHHEFRERLSESGIVPAL